MMQVPIQALPNQQFFIKLGNDFYSMSLRTTNGVMSVSIARNNVLIVENARCVAGFQLISSRYEENGNFTFVTANNQLPDYRKFNITQSLLFFTADELAFLRQPAPVPIASTCFNPLGALPLRYKPQGYALSV